MHIGGAENVVVELTRGLNRDAFDVEVCCTKQLGVLADQLKAEDMAVSLAAAPSRALRHLTPWYLRKVIRRFRADIIHTHGTPSLLHAGPLAVLGLAPRWVHTFHYGNYAKVQGRQIEMERMLCRAATQLVAVADVQRKTIATRYALDPERLVTITNGVTPPPIPSASDIVARRVELGIEPDEVVVGCVAVLSEQKGIVFLLRAARELATTHPRVKFLIVGGGPAEVSLRAEADALNLGSRVIFAGWKPNGAAFLPVLDIFVMSSLWEAMPMALIEAMAAARPVVVTDVGDNRAIVEDGRAGLVVPARDDRALAQAVALLLDNPSVARELAARARQRFTERFTTAHMIRAYDALYQQLIMR
jgi:glycosyltransferase involved in cell wall biosynthesis